MLHTPLADVRAIAGNETLLVPELVFVYGPFTLQTEYDASWVHDTRFPINPPAVLSEADVARLQQPDAVAFDVPGMDAPVEIRAGQNGRLVGVGGMIDPESRSVPVIFALTNPDPRIALNQGVQARVFTGSTRSALSVPAGAVIDDGGQRVVYVMRGGESFSRVPVRLGVRDGDRYEVLEGLKAGDRVVSRGAMQVRLAAATPEAMGHGHAH